MGTTMSSEAQADSAAAPEIAPAVVKAPATKAVKKNTSNAKKLQESSGKPKYKDMVMDAIITQKERSGSSLGAIKNHLSSKYKVDMTQKAGILNSVLRKMREEGVLVAGAQPGRKGAGCFKVSAEEKARMALADKVAARKLKAQEKKGLGKVASNAPKKVAKVSAGKKTGKKVSAKKTAAGTKKPVPKSTKAVARKGAAVGAKKSVAKVNKGKSG